MINDYTSMIIIGSRKLTTQECALYFWIYTYPFVFVYSIFDGKCVDE